MMKRQLTIAFAVGIAVDIGVALLLVRYFAPDSGDVLTSAILLVAFAWVVSLYYLLKTAGVLLLVPNDAGAKAIAAALSSEGFPRAARHDDAARYLARLANSDDVSEFVSRRATFYQGERAGMSTGGGLAKGMAFDAAWDKAIHLID